MMLVRAEPHVVAPAVPGHERHGHRRGVDDALRLARARRGAALSRVRHRPADEPQLHPPRRRRGRPSRRLAGTRSSSCATRSRPASPSTTSCSRRTRSGASAPSASASSPPRSAWRAASPDRSCARPASPGTCARRSRTSRTTRSTSTSIYTRQRRRVRPLPHPPLEILESIKIVRQCVENMPAGDYRVQDKKLTPPPRARIDESMEALIHHFKLFTEGFKVPAGETYVAIESPRGEIGCYMVSDGSGKPVRMHIRGPVVLQPAVDRADGYRQPRGRRGRDRVEHRPDHGRGRPVSFFDDANRDDGEGDPRALPARRSRRSCRSRTSRRTRTAGSRPRRWSRSPSSPARPRPTCSGRAPSTRCSSAARAASSSCRCARTSRASSPAGPRCSTTSRSAYASEPDVTVEEVECLAACGGAPALQVNYEFHEQRDAELGGGDRRGVQVGRAPGAHGLGSSRWLTSASDRP